jgi:hypothetical protein
MAVETGDRDGELPRPREEMVELKDTVRRWRFLGWTEKGSERR